MIDVTSARGKKSKSEPENVATVLHDDRQLVATVVSWALGAYYVYDKQYVLAPISAKVDDVETRVCLALLL